MKRYLLACAGGVGFLCLLAGVLPLGAKPAVAEVTPSFSKLSANNKNGTLLMAQVISVSQISDVQPTDWAFQALQSLVERYGCIAGYPDATYRRNRALTRYEFAAGLNACIDRVNELIATATSDLVNKEDLTTLQKLQEEFSTELAALRGRVDTFPDTPLGAGFFNGSTVAAAQLTFKPSKSIDIALNYANSHHQLNILAMGLGDGDIGTLFGLPATQDVHIDSVGGTTTWRLSPNVALTGYGAVFFVNNDGGSDASTTLTSWMSGVHFTDLFKKGNSAGILFGQPTYRTDASGEATLPENRETPYHLEAYYRFQVTDNISVTPGAFVLFNPEGNSDNDTTTVGTLRTTYNF